jgi:hypothetical protein
MNSRQHSSSPHQRRMLPLWTALALLLGMVIPNAWAKQPKQSSSSATVVAHLPFEGKSSQDMAMETQGSKRYLYVLHGEQQGVSVLDISNPRKPRVIGSAASPDPATNHLDASGALVMLSALPATSASAPDDLVLWDTSQPASPKVVKRFANVNKVLSDNAGFTYVLNNEGLWVVSSASTNHADNNNEFQWPNIEYRVP